MSNYVKSVNFASKDALASGNPSKLVRGTEIDTEYNNIATAIATKEDVANKGVGNGYAGLDSGARLTKTNQHASTAYIDAANTFAGNNITSNTAPGSYFVETDAAADNKTWRIYVQNEQWTLQAVNDAITTSSDIISIDRTGNTVDEIRFTGTLVKVNGQDVRNTGIINSGTFADARISLTSVSQHQANLTTRNVSGKTGTAKTLSTSAPSGGSDGDIWYRY